MVGTAAVGEAPRAIYAGFPVDLLAGNFSPVNVLGAIVYQAVVSRGFEMSVWVLFAGNLVINARSPASSSSCSAAGSGAST